MSGGLLEYFNIKVLQVRIQKKKKGSCRFKNLKHAKFDRSREQVWSAKRRVLQNLIKAHQLAKPIKWLGFHIYSSNI